MPAKRVSEKPATKGSAAPAVPFDDALRRILKAPPQHRKAKKARRKRGK